MQMVMIMIMRSNDDNDDDNDDKKENRKREADLTPPAAPGLPGLRLHPPSRLILIIETMMTMIMIMTMTMRKENDVVREETTRPPLSEKAISQLSQSVSSHNQSALTISQF